MINPWTTLIVALGYVLLLFAIASYGDRTIRPGWRRQAKPNTYAFSLAIYCTTWTFFGSVGLAATSGLSFLAIYVGPVIAITLGFPLMRRIIRLAKEERITSVADFLGSRYGKNIKVAAVAAIIAVIGTIPYIALQLKAISSSVDTLLVRIENGFPSATTPFGDISLVVALTLVVFTILFGTRHADATENQHGLMLAIASESVVKLITFLMVGVFVTWFMFDGVQDLFGKAAENENVQKIVDRGFDAGNFFILTLLSLTVFLLLPRQFHVAVVENNADSELKRARWLFPLYLVLINLFVIPITIAGILRFGIAARADDYVLLLPMLEGQSTLGLLVFTGGLSAGTAMVIVASVALAIMISNDLVLPLILRSRARTGNVQPHNMERSILNIRRTAIFAVLLLAYTYYKTADNSAALASIGLVSFAAIAQLAPAFFGGLFWKQANARGAMTGMITGFLVWAYCLLLPTLLPSESYFVTQGPFGITLLKPEALFGFEFTPIANGVIWSLLFNTCAFVFASKTRPADPRERMQASVFVGYQQLGLRHAGDMDSTHVRVEQLSEMLASYLGATRAKRALAAYWQKRGIRPKDDDPVDFDLLRHSEQLLASAIGASSSRLVHTLLIKKFDEREKTNFELLDEASRAVQFNRDVLQTALDQLEQGITVFDGNMRLASWNRQFRNLLNLPSEIGQAGTTLSEIAREIAAANDLAKADPEGSQLAYRLVTPSRPWQLRLPEAALVLEISTSTMPEGGIVVTWNDITERVKAAEALKLANETLEGRVEERTRELEQAKVQADQANLSKTRFLAAAGHDILQPLNAARLYSATLIERSREERNSELAENISRSLASVEEILGSILAISRLDSSRPDINLGNFALRTITEQLELEFQPISKSLGIELRFVHSGHWVHSDRAMLKRLLQNLISNALKFTVKGKVLVGVRKRGNQLAIEVHDTGIGISKAEQEKVFAEFTRLNQMKEEAPGLGLGLSIVERIADLLGHQVVLESEPGKGTRFQVMLESVPAPGNLRAGKAPAKSPRPGQLSGVSVLCIDNDTSILDGMVHLLQEWGCHVRTATDLQSAQAHLGTSNCDLLLVDYHLEETTGIDVFNTINHNLANTIPGILITADRSETMKELANEAGLVVLHKPVKPAALRALISQTRKRQIAAE